LNGRTTRPHFDKAKGMLPKHTLRGVPDIIAVRDGRAILFEVKTEMGNLSEDQEADAQYHPLY
jgi:hypothetical protein